MDRLMIGTDHRTADYQKDGWVCLDGQDDIGADIVAVIPPLPDCVTGQMWDEIYAIHFIEHLYYDDAKTLIRQIYDILKPDGRLVLEQANLEYVCKVILGEIDPPLHNYDWMDNNPNWCGIWSLYPQPHMTNGNNLNHHLYGYTPQSLTELVKECGFKCVVIGQAFSHVVERDFKLEAIK